MTVPSHGTAMVTGAGGGIGRACAMVLARLGCRVVLVGRTALTLRRVADSLPTEAIPVVADLTSDAGLAAAAEACPPRLDVLVHCAGLFHHGSVATGQGDTRGGDIWSDLAALNLRAPMLLTSACLARLRVAEGQIVFINSTAGLPGGAANTAYAASKHALRVAAEGLRQELRGTSMRVLSLFPGRTDTPMQRQVLAAEGRPAARIPLLLPEDVAEAALAALLMPRRAEITDIVIRPRNA